MPAGGRTSKAAHNTTEGGRTDDDGNDGNRNEDGGERAQGCGEAAGAHHEGTRGPDGRERGLPVAVCERGQAVDSQDAPEGNGGPGRGPRAGDRLPPGRRGDRREQLHPGARPRDGIDHAGPGRPRRGVLRIHVGGGPWPRQHGRQGPDPDRVGAQGPGQDRSRTVRQPPGERGERAEQLRPGARPRPGHDHAGAGRAGRRVRQLHVDGVTGPPEAWA